MPHRTKLAKPLGCLLVMMGCLSASAAADAAELRVVGTLGNSSSVERPVPYAFYTGVALDGFGRLLLIGHPDGVPVCDQDGQLLAMVPLPTEAKGLVPRGQAATVGRQVVFAVNRPDGSVGMVCAIDAAGNDASKLTAVKIGGGEGSWTVSPTLTDDGKAVVGVGDWRESKTYRVAAIDSRGTLTELVKLPLPSNVAPPWQHVFQAEPNAAFGVKYLGGANFTGLFSTTGRRIGEWNGGQIVNGLRYQFGYSGGLVRTDLEGRPAPGECGSPLQELRMAGQMAASGERYFFAGRGGVCEAKWDGTTFVYHRRIGGIHVEELVDDGRNLAGVAWQALGHNDVQHPFVFSKELPAAAILPMRDPLHGRSVVSLARVASQEWATVFRDEKGIGFELLHEGRERQAVSLPQLKDAGQMALRGGASVLAADPMQGVIWQIDWKEVPGQPNEFSATTKRWRDGIPGVTGLAITQDAVFASTPTQVMRFNRDGDRVAWTSRESYQNARRIAATPEHVYVCDEAAGRVDQLDAASGRRVARLDGLEQPRAIAADLNAAYIAENGKGRIVIAASTLWRPQIARLTRESPLQPVVAAKLPVQPVDGPISVNVHDENDLTVRQLACAVDGREPVTWDGRDYLGNFVNPGRYRFHGVRLPRLELKYVGSVGNAGRPPYRTADGRGSWGGVWGNVLDVCPVEASPASDILVLWAFEEGEGGLIRMSQDGEVRWKQHIQWWTDGLATSVCSDGRSAYIVTASAKGGPGDNRLPLGQKPARPLLWRVDVHGGAYQWYDPQTPQNSPMFGEYATGDVGTDIAVRDNKLYITSPAQGRLFVVDATSGKLLAEWKLPEVSGVAFNSAGKLFVGMQSKLVELDAVRGSVVKTLAALDSPIWDVETTTDGRFVVSTRGQRQQVVVLNPNGSEQESLGKHGGRPAAGQFVKTNFFDPAGLCATANGKLFVAEDSAPRRFSRWNLLEFARSSSISAPSGSASKSTKPAGEKSSRIEGKEGKEDRKGKEARGDKESGEGKKSKEEKEAKEGNEGGEARKGTDSPEGNPAKSSKPGKRSKDGATKRPFAKAFERDWHGPYYLSGMWGVDDEQPELFYGDSHADVVRYRFNYDTGDWHVDACWRQVYRPEEIETGDVTKWMPRILHRNGKTYWASGSAGLFEVSDQAWRPVAAVYGGWVFPDKTAGYRWRHNQRDHRERMGTWSDLNGDGRRQPGEWFATDRPKYPLAGGGPQQGWNSHWSPDFTLYMHDWSDDEAGGIWRLKPEWKGDTPIYRWEHAHHAATNRVTGIGRGSHGCRTAFAANGATYGFNGAYNDIKLPGIAHGADYRFVQITKYDEETGRMLWHAGERSPGFPRPGEMACPTGAAGLINERLFWTDENSLVHVWDDRHGLYLGTLLEDLTRNPEPSPYTVWVELFNSRVWRHPKTGKVYLGAASDAIHVYEVLGTETSLERFSGEFEVAAPALAAARREFESRQEGGETLRTLRIVRAKQPPVIDGQLGEFAAASPIHLALRPGARGTARVMHDAEHLFLAFDVEDDSPWKNTGGDITTLFKTGDCVDVWLGPSAGKRQPGIGDVRVLLAPLNGKPTAILYEAKVARDAKPVPFRSPAGEVVLDRVSVLAAARIAVSVTSTGYRLEAALPWKSIGFGGPTPAADAARIGFDLDINFSDPAGQRNTARLHWGRNGAAIVYDLPTEARFEPELWGVGLLE